MKTNKKFIKFFSVASGITFAACYLTSLIEFEKAWINSNFLFSVSSGVFASFIVVLVTEIKKYFDSLTSITLLIVNFRCCGYHYYEGYMGYIKTLPLPPPRCRSVPHQLPPASAVCS